MVTTILPGGGETIVDVDCRWLVMIIVTVVATGCSILEEPVETSGESEAPALVDPAEGEATAETTTAAASSSTRRPDPLFSSTIRAVRAEELGVTWRPGCPVAVEDLRAIELRHWNDTGEVADGTLVVHADHAEQLVGVFERLFQSHFPIHAMVAMSEFGGDDGASMTANNSSAFNCREIAGRPGVWSQHAFGGAVDINPLVNPWVRGTTVDPPGGAPYVDRSLTEPGMVVAGDVVTTAFAAIGWQWGGDWTTTRDYQHFSHDGR